jgi:hypothetical protein
VQEFCFRISAVALLTALTLSTCSAFQVQGVPEIDAGSGATALTLVAGVFLWVRQARQRR